MSSKHIAAGWLLSLATIGGAVLSAGCGYQFAARAVLPDGSMSLQLPLPDVTATDVPELGPELSATLSAELAKCGIGVVDRRTAPRLEIRAHALTIDNVVVSGRRTSGERWRLEFEGHLVSAAGATLWRSGLLTVRQSTPLPSSVGGALLIRALARRQLAALAARRLVLALTAAR